MKKERLIHHMLRILLLILGGALGIALVQLMLPILRRHLPSLVSPIWRQYILYAVAALVGVILMLVFSKPLMSNMLKHIARLERRWDTMPNRQIFLVMTGLLIGVLLATMCTQPILRAGISLLSLTLTALMYVLMGYLGARMGNRRYKHYIAKQFRNRHQRRRAEADDSPKAVLEMIMDDDEAELQTDTVMPAKADNSAVKPKVLDSSVLIGGRLTALYQCGLPEGRLIVPSFVVEEMQKLSDSAEEDRRRRGRRGLEQLKALQNAGAPVELYDAALNADESVDTALLRLCARIGGVCVTDDSNLCKVAEIADVPVLSLTRVLNALRAALAAGDSVQVSISREGKEPGQGVGYLEDGTMLVVEGARECVGHAVTAVVTSVLQTNAGRMVFARLQA